MSDTYTAIDNIEITQGDDYFEIYQYQDSDGNAIDITGYSISSSIKESESDVSPLLTATTALTDPTNGYFTVRYTSAQTTTLTKDQGYKYDIQVVNVAGVVHTPVKGSFVVRYQITT